MWDTTPLCLGKKKSPFSLSSLVTFLPASDWELGHCPAYTARRPSATPKTLEQLEEISESHRAAGSTGLNTEDSVTFPKSLRVFEMSGEKEQKRSSLRLDHLPISQLGPEYPSGQEHWYLSGPVLLQVPPLRHG